MGGGEKAASVCGSVNQHLVGIFVFVFHELGLQECSICCSCTGSTHPCGVECLPWKGAAEVAQLVATLKYLLSFLI